MNEYVKYGTMRTLLYGRDDPRERMNERYIRFYNQLLGTQNEDLLQYLARSNGAARRGEGMNISGIQQMIAQRNENRNAYLNEREAYELAGLNSALMYQNGGDGGLTADASGMTAAQDQFGEGADIAAQLFGQLSQVAQLGIQAQDLKSQMAVRQAQQANIEADTNYKKSQTINLQQQIEYFDDVKDYRASLEKNNADLSNLTLIWQGYQNSIAKWNVDSAEWNSVAARVGAHLLQIEEQYKPEFMELQKKQMQTNLQMSILEYCFQSETYDDRKKQLTEAIKLLKAEQFKNNEEAKNFAEKTNYVRTDEFIKFTNAANGLLGTIGNIKKQSVDISAGLHKKFGRLGFDLNTAYNMTTNALNGLETLQGNVLGSFNQNFKDMYPSQNPDAKPTDFGGYTIGDGKNTITPPAAPAMGQMYSNGGIQ